MTVKASTSHSKRMDADLLRKISQDYLLPFFSGASIDEGAVSSTASHHTVAFLDPQTIAFKVNRDDNYRLKFYRDQPFARTTDPARETRVIEAYVTVLERMSDELKGPLKDDLLLTFQRRVVAEAAAEPGEGDRLLTVIDQMALWSKRLYEGARIASAIGIDPEVQVADPLPLADLTGQDFFAVLSNGFDTMLTVSKELIFTGHVVLNATPSAGDYCPWRHSAIAAWTSSGEGRIAVVLNRLGEILIFRDGQLLFAHRSGRWHFLTHDPIIRQMGIPQDDEIRKAIYETALDASFARTGACIGVIASDSMKKARSVIDDQDWLSKRCSKRAMAIARIVEAKKFHKLDRTVRQELAAIDGATIIDHEGTVVAVGAILKIDGGSTGGGRTAAAKQLATLGLGVKISQDGGISGYRRGGKNTKKDRPAFKVM
jgi:hypothetical protein